jgi:hypothetical protein
MLRAANRWVPILLLGGSLSLSAGTRLSKAAIGGHVNLVKAFVEEHGEKMDETDKWGWTPLMWAVFYQQSQVTEYLLEKGANPDVRSEKDFRKIAKGSTALLIAGAFGMKYETSLLMARGAKADIPDSRNKTARDYAQLNGFTDVLPILNGQPWQDVPQPSDFGAGADLSALEKAYAKVQVAPFTTGPKGPQEGDYQSPVSACRRALLEALGKMKPFQVSETPGPGIPMDDSTLLVKVAVTEVRMPPAAARMVVGPLAGRTRFHVTLQLVDGVSGRVLREQKFENDPNRWISSFTAAGVDQAIPRTMGELLAHYVLRVAGKAS